MTHKELTREWQLERANLIAHLSYARTLLAGCEGALRADKICDKVLGTKNMTSTDAKQLDRITTYLAIGMFETLPGDAK